MPRYVGDTEGWEIPGERAAGEALFLLSDGLSDAITETVLPCSRRYDADEELARIRQVYARQACSRPRRAIAFNQNRSLRRI